MAKANVLLVGGGAVGTMAAVNIEAGGLGATSMVLRSNHNLVREEGYMISSIDHGLLKGWRPSKGTGDEKFHNSLQLTKD